MIGPNDTSAWTKKRVSVGGLEAPDNLSVVQTELRQIRWVSDDSICHLSFLLVWWDLRYARLKSKLWWFNISEVQVVRYKITCAITPSLPMGKSTSCNTGYNGHAGKQIISIRTVEWTPVKLFSKLNKTFFGYFDPKNMFIDNKNK